MIDIFQSRENFLGWLEKKRVSFDKEDENVKKIIREVASRGDAAVREYTLQFDRIEIEQFEMNRSEKESALKQVDSHLMECLERAKNNLYEYHVSQKPSQWHFQKDGKVLGQIARPLDSAGLYVPGGKGVYPSTVLMTAVPAKIAGVSEIAIITPPRPDGTLDPLVVASAHICGVDRVFKAGGVQGVAALAYGTEQFPRVDKIVGPGNAYVTMAKKYLYGRIDIDSLAGPSEVMLLTDEYVPLKYIVADMLAQAEHSEDAQSIVLVPSLEMAEMLKNKVIETIEKSPRKEILKSSIEENSCIVVFKDFPEACDLINEYAPEHLGVLSEAVSEENILKYVRHAGAIFMGYYTPVAIGDYFAGPNHTLPTSGTARYASPLGVYDFMKYTSFIRYNREQLIKDREWAVPIAEKESFYEHANSLKVRD
jgi:histidinol dehydrogenase